MWRPTNAYNVALLEFLSMTDLDLTSYQLVKTRLQESLANGSVRCHLCLWRCKVGHGQRGFCQAHVNRDGVLYNLSYGILSAMDIGPIESKPVRHFQPGSSVLSVGSYGCNFRCGGCHNLDISWGVSALDDLAKGESTSAFASPTELVDAALRYGVDGIAFTYSEPAVWLEYVLDVAKVARDAGLFTVYVSNSFVTDEALQELPPWMDVLCSDIKSLEDSFYKDICRVASVDQVLKSIRKAHDLGIHVETRTNIIPGRNDDPTMLKGIAQWINNNLGAESPWHITRFFPAYKLSHIEATPADTLYMARDLADEVGLKNVYVYDDKGCDCALGNLPVSEYLNGNAGDIYQMKKCESSCCDDEGILLKKYETPAAQ